MKVAWGQNHRHKPEINYEGNFIYKSTLYICMHDTYALFSEKFLCKIKVSQRVFLQYHYFWPPYDVLLNVSLVDINILISSFY